jgi:hypothetical protein
MSPSTVIDEELLAEAIAVGGKATEKETIDEALLEYIQRRKQLRLLDLFGKIDFDPTYEYKAQRRRA